MHRHAACLLLATLVSVGASAQNIDGDDGPVMLEPLSITARPPGSQSLEHTAQPVSILSGEELERRQANTLGETLNREPGVTGTQFGAGASRPVIRGLGGPRVRVLRDGIGTLDVSTISPDHQTSVEPFQAEQIEIMRGPATLLYGSGLSGGLVNVTTGRIPEYVPEFEANLRGQYESANNGKLGGVRVRGGFDQLALHFDGLTRDTDDYRAANGTVKNSFVETQEANLGTSWVGSRGFFGFSFGRYQTKYGIPIDPQEPDEAVFIDLDQNRWDLAGRLDDPFAGLRSISIRAGYNDYHHTEFEGPGEVGTVFKNKAWEGRLEFNHKPVGPLTGTVGVQYVHRDFKATGEEAFVQPAKQRTVSMFLFEDTDWRDWHFEVGGRVEHQAIDPSMTGDNDINHTVYSLSGGAIWNFTPGYAVGLTATRAQRPPALVELLVGGPHFATGTFEIGDTRLNAETSNNLDLSLRKTDGRLTWRANVFVNLIDNFIFAQSQDRDGDGSADRVDDEGNPGGNLLLVDYTQTDALFFGAEMEALYGLFDNANGTLDARLFGDWVRGQLSGGPDLPRISPARLGFGLDYHRGPLEANLETTQVFTQNATAPLETRTGGYTMLDLGLSYTLYVDPLETKVFLRGRNLLDETARRHNSFIKDRAPLQGRSAIVGVNIQF
ncbi:TonB-dependent receptor [Nitrococcus mobilis]|uniref:TonB-dependent receptor n=1 Tax=Nitrococcus mobilis Nb-231 TaxID=314278 RepID=A4BUR0_9GAMM|nr:TonB-dependent receptor [Nitrococcus mobilis]EAR20514.1 TonB-dependent receptor [Nitrococcus mobilis Nb-231]